MRKAAGVGKKRFIHLWLLYTADYPDETLTYPLYIKTHSVHVFSVFSHYFNHHVYFLSTFHKKQ